MRLFLDTEFTGLTQQAELISLALVSEEGDYFYAEFTDYDPASLEDWHHEHVLPHLFLTKDTRPELPPQGELCLGTRAEVAEALRKWLEQWTSIEVWADVPAYDWVLFCELFGGALQLPKPIHYIVRDLATLLVARGLDPDADRFALAYGKEAPPAGLSRHQALGDALACGRCLEKLLTP